MDKGKGKEIVPEHKPKPRYVVQFLLLHLVRPFYISLETLTASQQ